MQKKWVCLEIYAESREQRNLLVDSIVKLMNHLKEQKNVESYFFNRYSNPRENVYFMKFGFVNGDSTTRSELDNLLKNFKVFSNRKPYECEMWQVDGVPIDEIKCVSCEMFQKIEDHFKKKITKEQAFYLIHFLMNQIGYSYQEELALYELLEGSIKNKLGKG